MFVYNFIGQKEFGLFSNNFYGRTNPAEGGDDIKKNYRNGTLTNPSLNI